MYFRFREARERAGLSLSEAGEIWHGVTGSRDVEGLEILGHAPLLQGEIYLRELDRITEERTALSNS